MNKLHALYFPETLPHRPVLRQLLLFFDKIICYRPVENDPPIDDLLLQADLVDESTPAPLGDERQRFIKFIEDVRRYGAEYLKGQLSSLSHKAMHGEEDTLWSIVSSLAGKNDPKKEASSAQPLWQARFMLKLAELQALDQMEITKNLQNTERRKEQLYKNLQGDGNDGDETLAELSNHLRQESPSAIYANSRTKSSSVATNQLIRSWAQLFMHDASGSQVMIFVTANQDAAATLLDTCNSRNTFALGNFPLPFDAHLLDDSFIDYRSSIQNQCRINRDSIGSLLLKAAQNNNLTKQNQQELAGAFSDAAEKWTQFIGTLSGPASKISDQARISFYCLAGIAPQKFFGLEKNSQTEYTVVQNKCSNTILGVLQ